MSATPLCVGQRYTLATLCLPRVLKRYALKQYALKRYALKGMWFMLTGLPCTPPQIPLRPTPTRAGGEGGAPEGLDSETTRRRVTGMLREIYGSKSLEAELAK